MAAAVSSFTTHNSMDYTVFKCVYYITSAYVFVSCSMRVLRAFRDTERNQESRMTQIIELGDYKLI